MSIVKLNVLLLLALAGLKYSAQQPQKQISFFNLRDTVLLNDGDYTLAQRQAGFDILVLNKNKLKKITKLNSPRSTFIIDNKVYGAVGVNIFSSRLPDIGDYYFPVNGMGRIIVFKGNILNFKQISY